MQEPLRWGELKAATADPDLAKAHALEIVRRSVWQKLRRDHDATKWRWSTRMDIEEQLQLRPPGKPSITLKRITGLKPQDDSGTGEAVWVARDHEVTYSFPGKTKEEAWRFACVLRILSEIRSAIIDNVVVTKRDIFYHDPALFLKQEVVDKYIDDIAHTCRVRRPSLNVVASPKGLVAGLRVSEGTGQPETIPTSVEQISVDHLRWILVVEKEAAFNTLAEQKLQLSDRLGRGLLVTAKGYPDLATRQFIRAITNAPDFAGPVFGLFDYDPYGIDILKCYRVGSKASAGEPEISSPDMKWIGVKGEDVLGLESGRMALTSADRAKAQKLLEGMLVQGAVVAGMVDCQDELQNMLMLNMKAEIQALDSDAGAVTSWLERKMLQDLDMALV